MKYLYLHTPRIIPFSRRALESKPQETLNTVDRFTISTRADFGGARSIYSLPVCSALEDMPIFIPAF